MLVVLAPQLMLAVADKSPSKQSVGGQLASQAEIGPIRVELRNLHHRCDRDRCRRRGLKHRQRQQEWKHGDDTHETMREEAPRGRCERPLGCSPRRILRRPHPKNHFSAAGTSRPVADTEATEQHVKNSCVRLGYNCTQHVLITAAERSRNSAYVVENGIIIFFRHHGNA